MVHPTFQLAYRADAGDVDVSASNSAAPDPVSRLVVGRLDATFSRTPAGGLRVPASLTRTGVLTYRNPDGSVRREYRPADEVFKADSLATLEDAPVTDLHPSSMVTTANHGQLAKGHVRDGRQDGKFVAATVLVQDADLVGKVERKDRVEISCGYRCRLDMTAGTTPDGEHFDAIQRDIVYNHVALLPVGTGRAGREVALRLDAAYEDSPSEREPNIVKTIRIDGQDYVIGSEEHLAKLAADSQKAIAAVTARADKAEADLKVSAETVAKLTAERDAAVARIDEIEKPAKEAARKELETKAAKVLGAEYKFDGKSDADITADVAKKALEGEPRSDNGGARIAAVLSQSPAGTSSAQARPAAKQPWERPLSQSTEAR